MRVRDRPYRDSGLVFGAGLVTIESTSAAKRIQEGALGGPLSLSSGLFLIIRKSIDLATAIGINSAPRAYISQYIS